jgi:hypothetical protein
LKIRAAKNREYRLAKAHPNENFNHPLHLAEIFRLAIWGNLL